MAYEKEIGERKTMKAYVKGKQKGVLSAALKAKMGEQKEGNRAAHRRVKKDGVDFNKA